jgi:hypothetical protein
MTNNILRGAFAPLLLFIILFAFSASAGIISDMQVKNLFPKVTDLEGGAELWLNTGIRSKTEENHTVFSTTYSFYSGKDKKMMNIVRKGQYETNIALYSFNNFVDASMYFHELTKDAPKNRSQQVRFGERGLFFLYPKSGYINDADFYLVFINKTFVVWIHSNDGFALMDIANPINDNLDAFIMNNTEMYLIKKLHLEAYAEGYEIQTKAIEFTNEFPASIKVSGKVFTKDLDPMPAATVNILETGDSILTDSSGYFEHTIELDGISDIELAENFYLDYDKASKMTMFKGGFFESGLKYNSDGKLRNQIWKLETAGEKVFGTSYVKTSQGYKGYQIKGTATDEGIELTLDCRRAGSDFGCEQIFKGKLKGNGIEGEWSGTGGGGVFKADMGEYRPVERKIILTQKTAQTKTFGVNAEGKLLKSSENLLNIGASRDSIAMIYVKPKSEALEIDPIKNISAKLVLTHLPDDQSGRISLFKYSLRYVGAQAYLGDSSYAGQIYPSEEPYKLEIDITDMLEKGDGSIVIGGVPEAGSTGNHNFSTSQAMYDTLKPYIVITEYAKDGGKQRVIKPFVMINEPKKSADLIGDRNRPGKDGTDDYCYDAVFSYPGKKLTGFELEITGDIKRRYNTNPLDIYPLVGFINTSGSLLNDSKGALDYTFEKNAEKLGICINGSYVPTKTDRISYKYYIDGRPVEGLLN